MKYSIYLVKISKICLLNCQACGLDDETHLAVWHFVHVLLS